MTVYLLAFVIFLHGQSPQPIIGAFDTLANCQIAEGAVITKATQDPTVDGFVMPIECLQVTAAKKA